MGRWKYWLAIATLAGAFLSTELVWAEADVAKDMPVEPTVAAVHDEETIDQSKTSSETLSENLPLKTVPVVDNFETKTPPKTDQANATDQRSALYQPKDAKKPTLPTLPTETLSDPPAADFIPTPPNLRFIKVQLGDATRADGCQKAAEFVIVMNFGTSPVELSDVVFQYGKIGNSKPDSQSKPLKKMTLPELQSVILFNAYFNKGGSDCAANAAADNWLQAQSYNQSPRNIKGGYLNSDHWLKLVVKDRPEIVIDELDLSTVETNRGHDTLVAQTDPYGALLFDANGKLLMRSIQVHLPEQHLLDYEKMIIFQDVPEEPKNTCGGIIISEISVNVAEQRQFIEIYNTNDIEVLLAGCRLWTSWSGQSEYTFGDIEIQAGESLAVFMKDTKLQFSKPNNGRIKLRNELNEVVDELFYQAQVPESSLSLLGDEFATSFAPTPNEPNIDLPELPCKTGQVFNKSTGTCQEATVQENPSHDINEEELVCKPGYEIGFTGTCVKKCEPGYERNPDSNRCRKVVLELETALLPCPVGYERNPVTNRCRKIATTTQADLSPCPVGYERNPETNRCRKISNQQDCDEGYEIGFTGTCVKICELGYERSAETNRCRKLVAQAGESDVAPVKLAAESADGATPVVSLSWVQLVILGGVLAGAVAWRSRAAIKKLIKKVL